MFQQSQSMSILVWAKTHRAKQGKVPLSMRLTINGKRAEISAHREVSPAEWDPRSQIVTGRKEDAREINNHLAVMKTRVLASFSKLELNEKLVTPEMIKNDLLGIAEKPRSLMQIIREHNKDVKTLIGKGYAKGTWLKYQTMERHVSEFLQWRYKRKDFYLKDLKFEFINDFEFFLKAEKNVNINSNAKYIRNLRKIINECVAKDWLGKDPFMAYKYKSQKTDRGYLTELELQSIQEKEFSIERLEHIRDIFLFSCYTGLAYIDIYNLTPGNISLGMDGEKWIFTHRQKTESASRIPLLPPALALLEKYKDNQEAKIKGKVFPVPSNQKVNAYLKEIADCCGIGKELTFHMARHTFATTVTLTNGVPIETVSKMLGHRKIQTTQIYARILDKKVSFDMKQLKAKYAVNPDTVKNVVNE